MSLQNKLLHGTPSSPWSGGGDMVQQVDDQDQRLCNACRKGNIDEARAALQKGANPQVQFRLALGEITPIFLCASKGYIEIAELLIQHRADVNRRMDFDHTTCLHHAASNGQAKMCEFLIRNQCPVDAIDKLQRTPLMDAAEIGNVDVVTVLIQNEADVNREDSEHHTALSYCIEFINFNEPKFMQTAWKLVESGADPNYRGKFASRTILHCVAAQGNMDRCKALVEQYGMIVRLTDSDGKTAIDYARENGHNEIVEYLTAKNAEQTRNCVIL